MILLNITTVWLIGNNRYGQPHKGMTGETPSNREAHNEAFNAEKAKLSAEEEVLVEAV